MTTIAWDGKTISADSRVSRDGVIDRVKVSKIRKINDVIIAGAGDMHELLRFFERFDAEGLEHAIEETDWDELNVLLVKNKKCYVIESNCKTLVQVSKSYTIGSGGEFAKGALDAGCDSKTAVKIACKNDSMSGLPVKTFKP